MFIKKGTQKERALQYVRNESSEKQAEEQMKKQIHRIGRFYSSMIMGNIGLFIFVGFLSVIFQEQGWFPNESIYAVSQLVYKIVIPVCISYAGGAKISGQNGGILAVLTAAGMLYADVTFAILAAMISASIGGFVWKNCEKWIKEYAGASLQMLSKNLLIGAMGGILAIGGYYILVPVLQFTGEGIAQGVNVLLAHRLSCLFYLLIEPAKVFFLNNVMNHGILVPLGMQQLQEQGKSILFLLETNPGPGLGVLAALYLIKYKEKENYAAAIAAEFVGGIHEVYFPAVLSNLWLMVPLMLSSAAGALWFEFTDAGLSAPVSPGSFLTILLMAGKGMMWKVAAGVLISAGVSLGISWVVLKSGNARKILSRKEEERKEAEGPVELADQTNALQTGALQEKEEKRMFIQKIGFICDAGVGSSAMGAALFRRKLSMNGIPDLQVESYACDQIPDALDLLVCQKDFVRMLPEKTRSMEIFATDSLLDQAAFDKIIEIIRIRNG
ncbi:MAG: hypothetical protein SPD93_06725 [Lachnospiraceae bacterium]|nr:hypothetical protein [Lachnospiraceae bacterium]